MAGAGPTEELAKAFQCMENALVLTTHQESFADRIEAYGVWEIRAVS